MVKAGKILFMEVVLLGVIAKLALAFPPGNYTLSAPGGTSFGISVSVPAWGSGNQTVSFGTGTIKGSQITSSTPTSQSLPGNSDCLNSIESWYVHTADGKTYIVETTPCGDELTDGNPTDDIVGSFKEQGTSQGTNLLG